VVGFAPSGPSLYGISVSNVGLIDHTNIPAGQLGLWMELE